MQQAAQPGRQFMRRLSQGAGLVPPCVTGCAQTFRGVSRETLATGEFVLCVAPITSVTLMWHGVRWQHDAGCLGTIGGCPKMRQIARGPAHALSPRI